MDYKTNEKKCRLLQSKTIPKLYMTHTFLDECSGCDSSYVLRTPSENYLEYTTPHNSDVIDRRYKLVQNTSTTKESPSTDRVQKTSPNIRFQTTLAYMYWRKCISRLLQQWLSFKKAHLTLKRLCPRLELIHDSKTLRFWLARIVLFNAVKDCLKERKQKWAQNNTTFSRTSPFEC